MEELGDVRQLKDNAYLREKTQNNNIGARGVRETTAERNRNPFSLNVQTAYKRNAIQAVKALYCKRCQGPRAPVCPTLPYRT